MKIGGKEVRKHGARHGEAAILFAVGGHKFAIPATEVEEIRDLHGLQRVPASAHFPVPKVHFILLRERRHCQVVDASTHFRMPPSKATRVLVLRHGEVALTADSIDRMTEISTLAPLPMAFRGEECQWYRGLAVVDDTVIPVVNPAAVLTALETARSRDAVRRWLRTDEGASA